MINVTTKITFKDGIIIKNTEPYDEPDTKNKIFQGMSVAYQKNATIEVGFGDNKIIKRYSDVESIKIIFQ